MTAPQPPAIPPADPTASILLKLGEMSTQLAVISEQLKAVPDHEQRIRSLERWRYALPLSGLAALGSIILSIYQAAHR